MECGLGTSLEVPKPSAGLTFKVSMHGLFVHAEGNSYGHDRWKSTWDVIFYAVKGKKAKHGKKVSEEGWKINPQGGGFDVMIYPQPRPLLHKAQKPIELIAKLVWCSSNENDLVLDPFLGSGTTAVVCERLNRRWIGVELEQTFCEIAKERILTENHHLFKNLSSKSFGISSPSSFLLYRDRMNSAI